MHNWDLEVEHVESSSALHHVKYVSASQKQLRGTVQGELLFGKFDNYVKHKYKKRMVWLWCSDY